MPHIAVPPTCNKPKAIYEDANGCIFFPDESPPAFLNEKYKETKRDSSDTTSPLHN